MNKKINNLIAHKLIVKTTFLKKEKIANYLTDTFNVIELLELSKKLYDYKETTGSNSFIAKRSNVLLNEMKEIYSTQDFLNDLTIAIEKDNMAN
jgi:hypothetical protein